MHRLFLTLLLCAVSVLAARAATDEILLSPTNLNTFFYTFAVSTNAAKDGVAFHITITDKRFDIYPDSSANVGTVQRTEITNVAGRALPRPFIQASFEPLHPAIPVALKKEQRVWTADFTSSHELLKNTNTCFVFSVLGQDNSTGKTNSSPPADLYELKLQDFAKP